MSQFIYANASQRKELMERFKCSQTSITLALRFRRNSQLAQEIRAYAVNKLKAYAIEI